ncbi:MAG: glycosyltransferase [Desulfuromonadales bacterium]|nr:glycosyltransferase [Desulfuromonadales bacterium]
MAQVDLHVHSKYSNHPSEWFLQRLGASESYTEPETIYQLARKRGMDFVTVTDHNRIKASLELVKKHPKRCFTGVESTAYFPEDNCKVHILIYGLDREQFTKIQKKRLDIYKLRDYLKKQDLACVVAHATYSVNGKLTLDHLEKLILLFNNFEGRNGSRSTLHNDVLSRVLLGLTKEDIKHLQQKHQIEPWGSKPWKKSLTGGSDDHAGFFIAKTSTVAEAKTPEEFLQQLKQGQTQPQGRQNDFQGLTFAIYKIAFDFSQHKSTAFAQSTISDLTGYLFNENKKLSFRDRLRLNKMKSQKNNAIYQNIVRLIETSRTLNEDDIDARLNLLYDCISDISDQYFRSLLTSLNTNIEEMDIIRIIQGLSSSIPGIFLSIPFFSAFKHMFGERDLIKSLEAQWGKQVCLKPKRILWLTDTLTDLNGVSMTLQTIGKLAEEKGYDIRIMFSLTDEQRNSTIPQSTLVTPPLYSFQLPHYEELNINVPSVLRMLKQVYEYNPDEIYISTPGPVGMLGMLIGRMLGTEIKGIYHTDFTMESEAIIAEPAISSMIEQYSKWFFNQFDTLLVPTAEYMQLLKERGYRYRHMEQFKRGLRTEHFKPLEIPRQACSQAPKLLYVGRISKDKNLDFLMHTYRQLRTLHTDISLSFAGVGPYLQDLQDDCYDLPEVSFLGRVPYQDLPELYNQHDLFLFPSVTDTFGMVVLEAQACGIPAIVSNVGGPKEIVKHGETGFVLPVENTQPWVERIDALLKDLSASGEHCRQLGQSARERVVTHYSWDSILQDMIAPENLNASKHHRHRQHSSLKRILKLASNMMVH